MLKDLASLLDHLDEIRKNEPEKITYTYQKLFNTPEGELILIDLLDRFFEFKPTNNDREAGSQAVIIYIKNMMLGTIDTTWFEPKEEPNNAEQ